MFRMHSEAFSCELGDPRPKFEGRAMLSRLVKYGIDCGYVLLTALAYVLKDVTKVFLGAAGVCTVIS